MRDWPLVPIGELVRVRGGGTPKRDHAPYFQGTIPWVTPKDMKSWEINDALIRITEDAIASSSAKVTPANSVLLVVRSGILKHSAPVAINRIPVAINQDMKALECGERLHPEFLARFLQKSESIILGWVRATTADNYSIDQLRSLKIPLPPLAEQRRIAAILDQADDLRRKRQEFLKRLEVVISSSFQEFFGDPLLNDKGWPMDTLGNVGNLDRGVSKHRPRNDPALLGGAHPLIQTGDVANSGGLIDKYKSTYSDFGLKQSRMWPKGTLCITIAANIGKTGILGFDACFPDSVVGFNPGPKVTSSYVQFWLGSIQKILEDKAPESAQKNINLAILRGLELPIPPKELQERFDKMVLTVRKLNSEGLEHLAKIEGLFGSLQYRAFRGELAGSSRSLLELA